MRRFFSLMIVMSLTAGFVAGCLGDSDPGSVYPPLPIDPPAPIDPPVPIEPVEMDVTYEYDELNRLTAVYYSGGVVERYSYDEAGNLLSVERTVD